VTINNQFDVISIDWPWNFQAYSKDTGRGRSAAAHYDTDSLTWDDWRSFMRLLWPLMAQDCALCIWMVRPSEDEAIEAINYDWNKTIQEETFAPMRRVSRMNTFLPRQKDRLLYKTELFTLIKTYRSGKPFKGMGYYSRANSEPCKLWVRGKMPRTDKGVDQVLMFCPYDLPKDQRHSYKPPEYRRRIERLWPNKRYLEIFAREDAKELGWTYLGNEVTKNDIRHDLTQLTKTIDQRDLPQSSEEFEYRAAA
jgi:hypothetical protein